MTDLNQRMSSKEMSGEAPAQRRKTSSRRSRQIGSESTKEADKEDVDDEADPESGPSVLWEKRFEQSIFVDISDDESLHLSDLQGSFRVHVSQDQESMRSSENTGLSDSYEVEEDSSESPVSISSEHKVRSHMKDGQGNKSKASVLYPNTAPERALWRPEDDNTSDEDQEELPYDGDLHQNSMHHTESPKENSKELHTVNGTYQQGSCALHTISKPSRDAEKVNSGIYNTDQPIDGVVQGQEPGRVSASVPEFLLRHFSQDELLNCSRLIEAETMPEVSLLDSIDETALSRASNNLHTTSGVGVHSAKIKASPSLLEENESSRGESHTEATDSKTRSAETTMNRSKNSDRLLNHSGIHSPPDSIIESRTSAQSSSTDTSPVNSPEDEKEDEEENAEQSCSASTPNLSKADVQSARFLLGRTRSCSELKYGQGQVHYPLPDFSKVAPKVKIPKGNGLAKPGCQTPSVDRTLPTTGILGKSPSSCTADVISRVLEDSIWLTEMRKDEEKQSRLDQHLQAEYNRLLAKYAEDDNLINPMRLRDQTQASSDWREAVGGLNITRCNVQTTAASKNSTMEGLVEEKRDAVRLSLSEQQSITEGQRLTTELMAIISQFMEKVEEFKKCISNMSLTVEDQQKMFKSMMEAQDQLERNYMSKKEEHRVLEMQNYMGLDRNTGQFDPDRQVEGEIFRLGMQLEDIKEQIDRNTHHALSPPASSSTPTPAPHGEFTPSSSHQPALHEETDFSLCTSVGEEEEHFKAIEEPGAADSPLSYFSENCFRLHVSSQTSCISREDEEGSVSLPAEEEYCEDILAQLTEPASTNHQRAPNRPEDIGFHTQDLPEQNTSKAQFQRFVSPETDSGFGASDQSRPPTGLSHTQPNSESLSPCDVGSMASVSTSDNEASHSNQHTAISFVTWAGWGKSEPDQLSRNVQNIEQYCTTQNAPAGRHSMEESPWCEAAIPYSAQQQDPSKEDQLAQIQKPTAAEMPTRDKHLHCSCPNSEAISALQYEVSRLKRALEESLGHLPHLSMRTEYLSSMYSQEKRLRSRPCSRHKHRPSSSSRCLNTDLTPQRVEDWDTSDMEPSKSKDSREPGHPEVVSFRATHRDTTLTHSRSPSSRRLNGLKCSFTASLESLSQDTSQSKPSNNHQRACVGPASPGGNGSDANVGPLSDNRTAVVRAASHGSRSSTGPTIHGSRTSAEQISPNGNFGQTNNKSRTSTAYRPSGDNLRHLSPSPHLLSKPLLQTNYGSCNSLPPGFKVQDQQSDPEVCSRRRSTQSDTAMLPSNVYFQRTSPLPTSPCRTRGRSRSQRVKEEAINRTLDKALEAALLMKQTTDRMAKTLSADLAKARIYRKSHGLHPLSDLEQP